MYRRSTFSLVSWLIPRRYHAFFRNLPNAELALESLLLTSTSMLASLEGASQLGELICRFQWLVIHKDVWLVIHISRCRQGMTSVFSVLMVKQTDKLATNHVQGVHSGDPAQDVARVEPTSTERAGWLQAGIFYHRSHSSDHSFTGKGGRIQDPYLLRLRRL